MNFRNSEILTLRCLEGRKSYREMKSVSKSDKNWICYSALKKSLFLKQSLAELKMQFSKMVNFRPKKSCVYQNVQLDEQESLVKSKLLSLWKQPS